MPAKHFFFYYWVKVGFPSQTSTITEKLHRPNFWAKHENIRAGKACGNGYSAMMPDPRPKVTLGLGRSKVIRDWSVLHIPLHSLLNQRFCFNFLVAVLFSSLIIKIYLWDWEPVLDQL